MAKLKNKREKIQELEKKISETPQVNLEARIL